MHITWREKTLCIVFFEFRFDAAFKEGSPLAGLLVVYTYSLKMFSGYTRSIYLLHKSQTEDFDTFEFVQST